MKGGDARLRVSSTGFDARAWCDSARERVNEALAHWCAGNAPASLAAPMRHAVEGGGKRLRPLLTLAARAAIAHHDALIPSTTQDARGGSSAGFDEAALRAACALEMIHAYSLVHDDMPCMDNDVLRRGQPTVHVRFGQAAALLAGDALQARAFEILTPECDVAENSGAVRTNSHAASGSLVSPILQARLCRQLARAAGGEGMAGGQAIDLASVGIALDEPALRHMHRLKTGALLEACVTMGGACGAAPASAAAALLRYGAAMGLAFQIVDDILDVTGDPAALGKTAGKDAAGDKPTYVSLLGLDAARAEAAALEEQALAALKDSSLKDTEALAALATMVTKRSS